MIVWLVFNNGNECGGGAVLSWSYKDVDMCEQAYNCK